MKIEDVKEIFKYQLKLLTDKQEEFTELIEFLKGDMETMHLIPLGINVIITDLIYDKFEIEEEDTMAVMKNPGI